MVSDEEKAREKARLEERVRLINLLSQDEGDVPALELLAKLATNFAKK